MSTDETPQPEVEVGSVRDVLRKSPSYVAWEKTDAALKARLKSVRDQIEKVDEGERVAVAKWSVAKFNALNEGAEVPRKPEPPDKRHLTDALADVLVQQRQHAEQRAYAIVAAMEDEGVLDALRAMEADDLREVPPLYEALLPYVQRGAERATLVREYERLKASLSNTTVGAPRVDRITAKPDLYDLLQAAQSGRSLLDAAPVEAQGRKIEKIDSGYGLRQANGAFVGGYVDHDRPPPPPLPKWMTDDHSRGVG